MSKQTLYLLGILLAILFGTYFNWKYCCEPPGERVVKSDTEKVVPKEKAKAKTRPITSYPFELKDDQGSFSFNSSDNFNFEHSGFSMLRPISDDLGKGIDELQLYLGANDNKSVNITGLYTTSEENTSAFPNLGIARANAVKNFFITQGIPSSRMDLFGKVDDSLSPDGTVYKGPVSFDMITIEDTSANEAEEELEQMATKIKDNPLVLNFASGESRINLSDAQRQQFADIARYLDKVEGTKVLVEGHTDNTGSRAGNVTIGHRRANFAKEYLMQNGIPEARIETSSKGSSMPLESNATEAGRAKNRRTVVTIN